MSLKSFENNKKDKILYFLAKISPNELKVSQKAYFSIRIPKKINLARSVDSLVPNWGCPLRKSPLKMSLF